jgi:hypothetical protein
MIHAGIFVGGEVQAHLDALAALRLAMFRHWPYLYAGDEARERRYLESCVQSRHGLFVLAFDDGHLVGAASGRPLGDESVRYQRPFRERGVAVEEVFLLGEPVLLPEFLGLGLGHLFFDERERHARRAGFATTALCELERDADDPRCPPGTLPPFGFWSRRGYRRQDDMACRLDWPEIGGTCHAPHRLRFWLRSLDRA